jgi:type I restriction enzyme S subunit
LNYFKTEEGLRQLVKICPGSAGRNRVLSIKRIPEVLVPLPPLVEQRGIVAQIEELAAQIHEARALRHQAAEEAEALLVSHSRAKFDSPRNGWREMRIADACEAIIDYRGRTPPISEEGIPHITSANIREGRINWQTSKFVTEETYSDFMTRGIPRPQDVLFTMEAPLGEVGVVSDDRKFSLAQRVILLRPSANILTGDFLAQALWSPGVRDDIFSKATATTVSGIASKRLKEVLVPVPPLPEQRRIVVELDALQAEVDALKRLQAETAAELDALLPSILDEAFKGEL